MTKQQKALLMRIKDANLRKKIVDKIYSEPKERQITEEDVFNLFTLLFEQKKGFKERVRRYLTDSVLNEIKEKTIYHAL